MRTSRGLNTERGRLRVGPSRPLCPSIAPRFDLTDWDRVFCGCSREEAGMKRQLWKAKTNVMIDGLGWVYVVLVLDWSTKKIMGHYAELQAKTWHWLVAFMQACRVKGLTPKLTSPATTIRKGMPTRNVWCERGNKNCSGFRNGRVPWNSSRPSTGGERPLTRSISIRR